MKMNENVLNCFCYKRAQKMLTGVERPKGFDFLHEDISIICKFVMASVRNMGCRILENPKEELRIIIKSMIEKLGYSSDVNKQLLVWNELWHLYEDELLSFGYKKIHQPSEPVKDVIGIRLSLRNLIYKILPGTGLLKGALSFLRN